MPVAFDRAISDHKGVNIVQGDCGDLKVFEFDFSNDNVAVLVAVDTCSKKKCTPALVPS